MPAETGSTGFAQGAIAVVMLWILPSYISQFQERRYHAEIAR